MTRWVDVLVPHRNDPSGLRRSLDSIRRCESDELRCRVLVVDDGSSGAHEGVAKALVDEFSRDALLIVNPQAKGRPHARNQLLEAVTSPYVAWLDAGDLWYPEKLDAQLRTLFESIERGAEPSKTWVTCDYDWHWDDGRRHVVVQDTSGDQLRALLEGQRLRAYLWTLLAPAEAMTALGRFDPKLPRMQDLDFFLRFVAAGGRLIKPASSRPRPLCVYEKSDVGRDAREIRRCNAYIQNKHRELYLRYGRAFLRKRQVSADLLSLRFAKNNGDLLLAARYLASASAKDPIAATKQLWKKLHFR